MRTGRERSILILKNVSLPLKTHLHTPMHHFFLKIIYILTEQTKHLRLLIEQENVQSNFVYSREATYNS